MAVAAAACGKAVEEYVYTCSYSLWIYYSIITMDEEVSTIWPKIRSVGSIVYMLIKYPTLICIALDLSINWRFHLTYSLHTCHQLRIALNLFNFLATVSVEVAMLICLYALLGAERKHFYALGIIFVPMFITNIVLSNIILVSYAYARELSGIDIELGYGCPLMLWCKHPLYKASSWVSFARASLGALLVVVTLVTRHRNQKGPLITVIRRDGIVYLTVVFAIHFFAALTNLPGVQFGEQFGVIDPTYISVVPLCAIQLIFNIRRSNDRVPHAASTIFFPGRRGTVQSDRENATQDVAN